MAQKKKLEEKVEFEKLDLIEWLTIHYPKILIEYNSIKENFIQE